MAANWGFLVYMAGDNDLDKRAGADLIEIEKGVSANVDVAVHLDLPNTTTKFIIIRNKIRSDTDRKKNENAGDPVVLQRFLVEANDALQSPNYMLCLLNHGKGWLDFTRKELEGIRVTRSGVKALSGSRFDFFTTGVKRRFDRFRDIDAVDFRAGIGGDGTSLDALNGDEMPNALRAASKAIGRSFAIIGCDACYMSMLEVVFDLREIGQFFVGSQELEEGEGWPYEPVLNRFQNGATPEAVAKGIIADYKTSTAAAKPPVTLSAIDLSKVDAVVTALDDFGAALTPLLTTNLRDVALVRGTHTETFSWVDYIDLSDFAEKIAVQFASRVAVVNTAKALRDAVDTAVLARSNDATRPRAHGISIYIPERPVDPLYHDMDMATAAPRWRGFVEEFGRLRNTVH